ncbi:MAG: hypothetical protein ABIO04_04820 [Ferruginibacter sp.]
MQDYANSNRLPFKTILFFIAVLFIAYLPVSSCMFFLKNDAFNGYFPPKFFMSESIRSGHLPLWNPYINFGFPQYGDMSSGYWSPFTWLISSTVGYNAYTLTFELLFYILLAGIGMYKLTGQWVTNKHVRTIAGVAYMCSGYFVGHMQHFNWLSGAAFLPFCLWSYLLLLNKFSIRNSLLAAMLFYLFVSSAHPGITISAFYFFIAVLIFYLLSNDNYTPLRNRLNSFAKTHLLFLALFLLMSAGMIAGYLDILPHFVRGEKISLGESLSNPTNVQSWISSLLPFATVKNDAFYETDISMRNCYFGLSLLLFFIVACIQQKTAWQRFLLITGSIFALLSSGGILKTLSYKFIPFIGYVRLNGEFRIFALLCFIIVAAIELDKFLLKETRFEGVLRWVYYAIEIVLFLSLLLGMYHSFGKHESFIYSIRDILSRESVALKLKMLIDTLTFYDTLWIQSLIQLLFLWAVKWCIKKHDIKLLMRISVVNIIVACLFNIPFTGVGKASVAQVQHVLNRSEKGIPIPPLQPVFMNDSLNIDEKALVGDWSMYNKQIGVKEKVPYPIILKNMDAYFNQRQKKYLEKPFVFIEPTGPEDKLVVNSFSPNKITVSVTSDTSSVLILQQNYYPHWYYINGSNKRPVDKAGVNFMSAPIRNGKLVTFSFQPLFVEWMMLLSAVCFFTCFALILTLTIKPSLVH